MNGSMRKVRLGEVAIASVLALGLFQGFYEFLRELGVALQKQI